MPGLGELTINVNNLDVDLQEHKTELRAVRDRTLRLDAAIDQGKLTEGQFTKRVRNNSVRCMAALGGVKVADIEQRYAQMAIEEQRRLASERSHTTEVRELERAE